MTGNNLTTEDHLPQGMEERAASREALPLFGTLSTDLLVRLDQEMCDILRSPGDIETVRKQLFDHLSRMEYRYHSLTCQTDALERVNALYCLQVLKNIISPRNERVCGASTLVQMVRVAGADAVADQDRALFMDFYQIVKGAVGRSDLTVAESPDLSRSYGREAAIIRSDFLDKLSQRCHDRISSYPTGLDPYIVERRRTNRQRIMEALGADDDDWNDYRWHLHNVRRDVADLEGLIDLRAEEREAIDLAVHNHLPFGITPYYLSLMDREAHRRYDHAVRAQVIPPLSYVRHVLASKGRGTMDFMRETDTSPVDLVTRRYPMIAILKPYNSCAQICVYCQRNWEIDEVLSPTALAPPGKIAEALAWFEDHPLVSEILITGGDPMILSGDHLAHLMAQVGQIEHIKRVRFGTRLPVVLPMRFDRRLIEILGEFNQPARREVCLVTHFEHPYEVTPETMECINDVRRAGLSVYNQQVFTIENSRRFETVTLRLLLKQIGVDPYYTFNTKGKEETDWYRVPIARILQERKEESRMIPGLARTDVPVFNIPALGKNNLTSWQNHDLIMISPNGERIYEFHPWEKNIVAAPTYFYWDVPILNYLRRLAERGEDPRDYSSIWYYF